MKAAVFFCLVILNYGCFSFDFLLLKSGMMDSIEQETITFKKRQLQIHVLKRRGYDPKCIHQGPFGTIVTPVRARCSQEVKDKLTTHHLVQGHGISQEAEGVQREMGFPREGVGEVDVVGLGG